MLFDIFMCVLVFILFCQSSAASEKDKQDRDRKADEMYDYYSKRGRV